MDYKELIKRLRVYDYWTGESDINSHPLICDEAATAIETLLAERDALMKDVVRCDTCLHVKECYFNELRRTDCANSNRGHWKWRGPQKEGGA